MNTITEPIRVNSFSELKEGDKIWSIRNDGTPYMLEFVKPLEAPVDEYAIFLNVIQDGTPKFYEGRFEKENWYKCEDIETTWYHIYSAQAKFYEDEANSCKRLAEAQKNAIENKEEEYSNV